MVIIYVLPKGIKKVWLPLMQPKAYHSLHRIQKYPHLTHEYLLIADAVFPNVVLPTLLSLYFLQIYKNQRFSCTSCK